jgi:hypothetical protein
MSLQEIKEKLRALMDLPFNERREPVNTLEEQLTKDGLGLYWDDSNERYCIYLLEERER